MWKRSVLVLVFGSLTVGALVALSGSHLPAQAAQPPVAARTNPFSTSWLAAYHGLFDNIWTAEYESRGQAPAQARSRNRDLSALISPFQPNADVRMSNSGFNTEQNEFQIDINPLNHLQAIGASNDLIRTSGTGVYVTNDGGRTWSDRQLGHDNDQAGEYLLRLRIGRYASREAEEKPANTTSTLSRWSTRRMNSW